MSAVFLKILNMSITASWLILAVVPARLLLKKAPKWVACLLWGLVAVRLICPFSFESVFSLIPSGETIPSNIALQNEPYINSGITLINEAVNPVISESFSPSPESSVNPLQVIISIIAAVWTAGIVVMLAYALVSYLKLKKTVSVCVPINEGILSCDEVKAPFILGGLRPVIYVPSSMQGEMLDYVLRHETAHLQRRDHWWKPLGFLLLSVYWFNPLCWIAYILLCRDIEMACDEKVIRDMDKDDMATYSQALLDCSFPRKRIAACPLAFGEVGVKERVKGVLNYKKPAFWVILIAIVACIVLAVCLMTDPFSISNNGDFTIRYELGDTAKDFISTPSGAKTGDTVEVRTQVLFDADIHVYVDGQEIGKTHYDSDYWGYSFIMPDKDVLVTARVYTQDEIWGTETVDLDFLREKYPEYFDLSTSKGLELYVWQMAPDSYSCGLMFGTNRNKTLEERMKLKGVSIAEMRAILTTYDIDEKDVFIIPWQNPISSYISEYWIIRKDEDPATVEKRKKEYIDRIRQMLFDTIQNSSEDYTNTIVDIKTTVAYANWTEGGMMRDCLNVEKMIISSVRHLPVYKLDTLEDLTRFKESYKDILTLDQGYDEVLSFNEVTASYDNSFFADHTLVLAYVEASSGSFRYAIQDVTYGDSTFCLDVVQTNHPEIGTTDMAGWFVIAEVLDSDIADIAKFDATLQH